VSPAATLADELNAPVHKQLPAVLASQADQCVNVSLAATFDHVTAALEAMLPLLAALNETA